MDRCRVWESHADPEIRRASKPGPEPIYPAYAVGDSDKVVEEIRVAAVTKSKSPADPVEDLLRRLLAGVTPPAPVPTPVPEVPMVEKLLQHLEPAGLETLLRSLLSGQRGSLQQPGRVPSGGIGMTSYVFHAGRWVIVRLVALLWLDESFPFMLPG